MKTYLYLLFFFISFLGFSQETITWIKTEGTIQKIDKKRRGRTYATVTFSTQEGEEASAYIELFGLPVIGSFKSVGDVIDIHYDKNNIAIAKSNSGKFISQYGMIILIVLGVIFSAKKIIDVRKLQQS
ncbi:DUF3592 domain-containing protein [uncultured Tenacibaculum sp.]|uniref:DUF3592 domain-containing protein n=1 Tax=uncultured Tenacibaculum sp. TaxID=174713 RepID=UPI0026282D3C|nr:DUF3592 domain-containing protein [uncultured Tenacibaculum sp.]